jgi:hypothetical protein
MMEGGNAVDAMIGQNNNLNNFFFKFIFISI